MLYALAILAILAIGIFDMPLFPRVTFQRVGGITFVRVHRFQFSFCVCKETASQKTKRELHGLPKPSTRQASALGLAMQKLHDDCHAFFAWVKACATRMAGGMRLTHR